MRVLLFTGKGGVGKTTLAAATAARFAANGRKALVVSTDPAHSLGDVLDADLGADPTEVSGGLYAAHVDARRLVDGAWSSLRQHLGALLAGAGVDELAAEELTVLPGFEELLALGEVHELAANGPWEIVVVDCAPTAETLRLLALPEAVAGYLERLFPAHRRMVRGLLDGLGVGGRSGARSGDRWTAAADALSRLAERLDRLRALLTDPSTTSVRLVLTPERVVLAEVRRTLTALALLGIRVDGLVANRLVPRPGSVGSDPVLAWVRARRDEQDAVLADLRADAVLPVHTVDHLAVEPVGAAALAGLVPAELADDLDVALDRDVAADGGAELLTVRRVAGAGRAVDSEFELRVALPSASTVGLARVRDELAVTVDGRRRLLALPSVLRRCVVVGAGQDADGLTVRFRPDPAVWMR